ncbi:MAG TPA: RDD family protein [Chryseolinea sp.]|nr:RDD family protein [Chryseolinea sp.]
MQTVRVRTTQNVFIDYPVASIGDRIFAYLIDRLILILYTIAVAAVFIQFNLEQMQVWLLVFGLPWLFYSLAFEILMNGQTPGKRVMKIQVVQLNGIPPTVGNYLLRWIFALVDFYILSGAIAVVCIALGGKGQRIGDIVAGTSVVKIITDAQITAKDIFVVPDELHVTTFNQVSELSPVDIELIQRALEVNQQHGNDHPMNVITTKIKSLLNIQSDLPPREFLTVILKDYSTLNGDR